MVKISCGDCDVINEMGNCGIIGSWFEVGDLGDGLNWDVWDGWDLWEVDFCLKGDV